MPKMSAPCLAALLLLAAPAFAQTADNGRLLASNCFQCHGTNGKPSVGGFDRLAGMCPPRRSIRSSRRCRARLSATTS